MSESTNPCACTIDKLNGLLARTRYHLNTSIIFFTALADLKPAQQSDKSLISDICQQINQLTAEIDEQLSQEEGCHADAITPSH